MEKIQIIKVITTDGKEFLYSGAVQLAKGDLVKNVEIINRELPEGYEVEQLFNKED